MEERIIQKAYSMRFKKDYSDYNFFKILFGLFSKDPYYNADKIINNINSNAEDLNNKIMAAKCANLKANHYKSSKFAPHTKSKAVNAYSLLIKSTQNLYMSFYEVRNSENSVGPRIISREDMDELTKMLAVVSVIENLSAKFNHGIEIEKISKEIFLNIESLDNIANKAINSANNNYMGLVKIVDESMGSFRLSLMNSGNIYTM